MTLEDACKTALEQFVHEDEQDIRQILDTDSAWIFMPGEPGVVRYGGRGIIVYKDSGRTEPFRLPSKEGFELLKTAQEVNIPDRYIKKRKEISNGE